MLLAIIAVIGGLILLVWSADRFVEGAAAMASNLGVSSLIIGITIVGFGTSAPEILISLISVFEDTPDLAIGNALGSNIANIALILGATALLAPLAFTSQIIKREFPVLFIATLLLTWVLWDAQLDTLDGALLLITLGVALGYLLHASRSGENDAMAAEMEMEIPQDMSLARGTLWTLAGLLVLVASSKLLVWGAVSIATELGVSELVIGLTIVALGTSLPELAAAIASARKGEPDLIMGNIIGSNLFNSLAVTGIPAVLVDFKVSGDAVSRDLPVMLAITLLLFVFIVFPRQSFCHITRGKALVLLCSFIAYQVLLYVQAINTASGL
jgi:cation:H+ antiporter